MKVSQIGLELEVEEMKVAQPGLKFRKGRDEVSYLGFEFGRGRDESSSLDSNWLNINLKSIILLVRHAASLRVQSYYIGYV